ncbi:MAG: HNH endonuclease [Coxiellaceae bacterium]|nr:MAG: HNH endonuclease [Coxiellaceae bacterium]
MSYHPLILSASPGNWRMFAARKADPAFLKFSERIFTRDNYACQFCGFQARQHQEIINLDGNYHNNKLSNLVTACCFCAQCLFLEAVGKNDYGGGVLIYMPEMQQVELNGLCHVLFCAIANATHFRSDAQTIYRSLKSRTQMVDEKLGEGMSDPSIFGRMIIETSAASKAAIQDLLTNKLRLLPSRTKFSQQISDWAAAAANEMTGEVED